MMPATMTGPFASAQTMEIQDQATSGVASPIVMSQGQASMPSMQANLITLQQRIDDRQDKIDDNEDRIANIILKSPHSMGDKAETPQEEIDEHEQKQMDLRD